ncbi:hypothetical protein F5Y04DRAFT_278219 [Hypomontagnella monticulosa]|nr:hypothetical protein F5Y04DRAFT_278219 [Hypomontagnella monticulosa]
MSDKELVETDLNALTLDVVPSTPEKLEKSPTPRPTLLSLPLEIRLLIYEELTNKSILNWSDCVRSIIKPYSPGLNLLQVCKQLNDELAPIIYSGVYVDGEIWKWISIFEVISIRNFEYIQNYSFRYRCRSYGYPCWGEETHERHSNGDGYLCEWDYLFRLLADYEIRPKSITIEFDPCRDAATWRHRRRTNPKKLPPHTFSTCVVYRDLWFLKHLWRCLGAAQRVTLVNYINPLVGLALRQRFGFIIKRQQGWAKLGPWPKWELISPESFNPARDLEGYKRSQKLEGIYDKEGEAVGWDLATW